MAWLLDTNAWIDYLRNPASAIRGRLAERQPEEILTYGTRGKSRASSGRHEAADDAVLTADKSRRWR